jgi:hypothetical protein
LLSRAELFWAALQYIIFRYGAVVSETLQRQTKLAVAYPVVSAQANMLGGNAGQASITLPLVVC